MCVLSICQILIVNFCFFSYKYDIAPVVCATHLLVFDFLHLLGVSKSTLFPGHYAAQKGHSLGGILNIGSNNGSIHKSESLVCR